LLTSTAISLLHLFDVSILFYSCIHIFIVNVIIYVLENVSCTNLKNVMSEITCYDISKFLLITNINFIEKHVLRIVRLIIILFPFLSLAHLLMST